MLLVWGNCQAEALRVLLGSVEDQPFRTVRVPAVHQLTDTDVPHLRRLAGLTAVLVSQPIRSGYRDLPLGTGDIAAMLPPGSRVLRWPVVSYSGLEHSAIVRDPAAPSADAPIESGTGLSETPDQ